MEKICQEKNALPEFIFISLPVTEKTISITSRKATLVFTVDNERRDTETLRLQSFYVEKRIFSRQEEMYV
jgi:hypothetical protein